VARRRSIGLLLHPREEHRDGDLAAALARAAAHGFDTWTAVSQPEELVRSHAEDAALLVTVGGDGTFLLGARLAAPLGIPVLGVNRGQLGFLTDVDLPAMAGAIDAFAEGRHRIERRSLLGVHLAGEADDDPRFEALALNEVVVKSDGLNLARIRVEVEGELLGEFDADGVIIATATGSTAYALSAGGPLVDPRVRALLVVPLAAHAVITRAVVLPEAVGIDLTVLWGRGFAGADGHVESPLSPGNRLEIRPGPELQIVQVGAVPFVRRLREKVRFGMPLKEAHDAPDGHRVHERQDVDADDPAAADAAAAPEGG
jgi:NAD+ kinase